jgi:pimeloyl-ACP methyl ester carboxylesterase
MQMNLCRHIATAMMLIAATSASSADKFQDLSVTMHGSGRPVVLLHGLNSSSATWDDLCQRFEKQITCYQIQMPGFVGTPALASDNYMTAVRDQVIGFIRERKLDAPVIVGHSLGGVLAMSIAIEQPKIATGLLIVDSLPFLPAAQNPGATSEVMRPIAELTRRNMEAMNDEQWAMQAQRAAKSMVTDPARQELARQWSVTSARKATGDAMYAVMTTDLRNDVERITVPTTVLASWTSRKTMPGTREETQRTFEQQYARLRGVRVLTTEDALHFVMWDDPQLTDRELSQLLDRTKNKK